MLTDRESMILICRDAIHQAAATGDAHGAVARLLSDVERHDRKTTARMSAAGTKAVCEGTRRYWEQRRSA